MKSQLHAEFQTTTVASVGRQEPNAEPRQMAVVGRYKALSRDRFSVQEGAVKSRLEPGTLHWSPTAHWEHTMTGDNGVVSTKRVATRWHGWLYGTPVASLERDVSRGAWRLFVMGTQIGLARNKDDHDGKDGGATRCANRLALIGGAFADLFEAFAALPPAPAAPEAIQQTVARLNRRLHPARAR